MQGYDMVVDKLLRLMQYLEQLSEIRPSTYESYMNEPVRRLAIERLIQLLVDLALDINNILLATHRHAPASDYFNSFIDMAEVGILDVAFATAIAPSTSIRNRLVHEYEKTDDKIVFASLEQFLSIYAEYAKRINTIVS